MPLHIYPVTIRSVTPSIHCLLSRPTTEFRSAPTVIYFHGLNGTRNQVFQERYIGLAEAAQKLGYNLLSMDLRGHGERRDSKEITAVESLLKVITHPEQNPFEGALIDIRKVIEFLIEKSISPAGEIGVIGLSWGALHALYALRQETMVRCGVALLPVCKVTDLIEFRNLKNYSVIEKFEPVRFLEDMSPKPLLIVTAEKDNRVSPEHAGDLYQKLLPSYEKEGKTDLLAYSLLLGLGHTFDARMTDLAVDWFKRHLVPEHDRPAFR